MRAARTNDDEHAAQIDAMVLDALHDQIAALQSALADLAADHVLLKTTATSLVKQLSDANIRNRKLTDRIYGLVAELRALRPSHRRAA